MPNKSMRTAWGEREPQGYVVGEVYFFVTYPDTAMRYPIVESYVFLGMNFSDEDTLDTWYFQPMVDFVQFGSAIEGSERPVSCVNSDEIVEFQNERQLSKSLIEAAKRRSKAE